MIRKIEIADFMSHVRTTVEPAPGLTVIAGPNNCGKSAILQAVYLCVRYVRGDFMVRHGCESAMVTVTMADGTRVGFRRAGNSTFVLNDTEGLSHNNENASKAAAAARLSEVADGNGADVHFAMQKSPIFLLGDPGSQKARFFASSSDAGKLLRMKALLKARDLRDKDVVKRGTSELARVESQLAALAPIGELCERAEQADGLRGEAAEGASRADALLKAMEALELVNLQLQAIEAAHAPLKELTAPPRRQDESALEKVIGDVESAIGECERLGGISECMKAIALPPEMAEESELVNLEANLGRATRACDSLRIQIEVMEGLRPPPEPPGEELAELSALVEVMAAIEHEEKVLAAEAARVSAETKTAGAALARRRVELGTCPLCGAGFAEGHHHPPGGGAGA